MVRESSVFTSIEVYMGLGFGLGLYTTGWSAALFAGTLLIVTESIELILP